MYIIIDSNRLFAALIKDSITRKIILQYNGYFLFPSYVFDELEEHKPELLAKCSMDTKRFNQLLGLILQKVVIVPPEMLTPFKSEAIKLVKDIDIDDAVFVACALAYKPSVIWSDDKKLKNVVGIRVVNTKEIKDLFNVLS